MGLQMRGKKDMTSTRRYLCRLGFLFRFLTWVTSQNTMGRKQGIGCLHHENTYKKSSHITDKTVCHKAKVGFKCVLFRIQITISLSGSTNHFLGDPLTRVITKYKSNSWYKLVLNVCIQWFYETQRYTRHMCESQKRKIMYNVIKCNGRKGMLLSCRKQFLRNTILCLNCVCVKRARVNCCGMEDVDKATN